MASDANRAGNAAEIDRLALALAKEPGSKAFIPLAEEYGKAGMWEEAAAVLEDGLKSYPNFITAMVALGRAYDQLNQPVKAKAILEEAVKLSPENLRAHRTLAKIYVAQGAKEPALRSCDVILAVNPQDQEALSFRATFGASGTPASAGHATPGQAKSTGQLESELPDSSGDTAPKMAAETRAVSSDTETPPATVTLSSQGELMPSIATDTAPTADEHRSATVTKLEQWLSSIQARRRVRNHPTETNAPTS
ncbi:MAG TPA: tetratricopeptide repeat protein [Nitrospiraceae bacterium]|nr:tetratricopeptide repeat protein [Nitrospiraceae bacterium]